MCGGTWRETHCSMYPGGTAGIAALMCVMLACGNRDCSQRCSLRWKRPLWSLRTREDEPAETLPPRTAIVTLLPPRVRSFSSTHRSRPRLPSCATARWRSVSDSGTGSGSESVGYEARSAASEAMLVGVLERSIDDDIGAN